MIGRGEARAAASIALAGFLMSALVACSGSPSTSGPSGSSSPQPASSASPSDATEAIVHALSRYPVVAIGESHNLAEAGEFYDALVKSPDFARAADSVVVEFGNARFQALVDRYVAGKDVSPASLRRVWQDTTQVGAWDAPMYGQFFAAVRRGNESRPPSQQLRVLLGDPPIDWQDVASPDDVRPFLIRRERFLARTVERQVVDVGEHALLIAGMTHLVRADEDTGPANTTALLDRLSPGSVYVVGTHLGFPDADWEKRLLTWPIPSILDLAGTWIGELPEGTRRAQDAFDAMLYLGPPDSLHLSLPLPTVYMHGHYWQQLRRRWALSDMGPFSADALFSAYADPGYPGLFSTVEIMNQKTFAACMRSHRVDDFPDPEPQYDAFGFYGAPIQRAREDKDYPAALKQCLPLLGLGNGN
jgi:uncharacterized iron-regulated protein